jgi:hypothetical protein
MNNEHVDVFVVRIINSCCFLHYFYSAHFKLSFRTVADSGILFYAEGSYHRTDTYDFEGLFMRDGYLHYFLFNPPRNSHGTSFGFHGKSKKRVNDGQWHQVKYKLETNEMLTSCVSINC